MGGDLGDGVGQGSIVVYAGGQSVGVDESRVSLGISGPLCILTNPGIDIFWMFDVDEIFVHFEMRNLNPNEIFVHLEM